MFSGKKVCTMLVWKRNYSIQINKTCTKFENFTDKNLAKYMDWHKNWWEWKSCQMLGPRPDSQLLFIIIKTMIDSLNILPNAENFQFSIYIFAFANWIHFYRMFINRKICILYWKLCALKIMWSSTQTYITNINFSMDLNISIPHTFLIVKNKFEFIFKTNEPLCVMFPFIHIWLDVILNVRLFAGVKWTCRREE